MAETPHGVGANVSVRRIRADEGPLLRELRLRSLADAPEAFGERLDHAEAQPEREWLATARAASRGARRAWFIAETGEPPRPVGLVQARRRPPESCLLFSMWVDPAARKLGVGQSLLAAVEEWAGGWGAREVVLWVFESNVPAIRLYEKAGYKPVREGRDRDAGKRWRALAMRRAIRPMDPA